VSELETIIPAHDQGALSLPASGPEERTLRMAERVRRLAVVDPEQLVLALHFLIGYQPRVFDAAMDAVEPDGAGAADTVEEEAYCVRCGVPVGIFAAHGPGYRHYKGVLTAASKPRPYKADHKPVIGWRRARDADAVMS
jgi:hypothetical protein